MYHFPKISVVVPLFNEEENLIELHKRLRSSLDPLEVEAELVFVNDGSTDDTAAPVRPTAPRGPIGSRSPGCMQGDSLGHPADEQVRPQELDQPVAQRVEERPVLLGDERGEGPVAGAAQELVEVEGVEVDDVDLAHREGRVPADRDAQQRSRRGEVDVGALLLEVLERGERSRCVLDLVDHHQRR